MKNIYETVAKRISELPEDKRLDIFSGFWDSLTREEQVIFTCEAMAHLKATGEYDDFIKLIKGDLSSDADLISYINNVK